jgi:hypothetical protein
VAARRKVWVCGHSVAWVAGSNRAGGMDVCLYVSVVCCLVDVRFESDRGQGCPPLRDCCVLSGRCLCDEPITRPETQHTPTECGVSEFDFEISAIIRPKHTGGCRAIKKLVYCYLKHYNM